MRKYVTTDLKFEVDSTLNNEGRTVRIRLADSTIFTHTFDRYSGFDREEAEEYACELFARQLKEMFDAWQNNDIVLQ